MPAADLAFGDIRFSNRTVSPLLFWHAGGLAISKLGVVSCAKAAHVAKAMISMVSKPQNAKSERERFMFVPKRRQNWI
jgi:hypothetical protein